jgi:hypothetical protein
LITISTEMGITAIIGLVGCISFLFKLLINSKNQELKSLTDAKNETIREKDETIRWLKDELRISLRTTERATTAAETATVVAKKAIEP